MAQTKTAKNAKPSLDAVIAELEADGLQLGLEFAEPKWYSSGNMAIDCKLGGGIPVGKIVEFAGPNASGKTTTAISVAAGIIEQGGIAVFCDFERAIDKPYFRALGVDPDDSKHFKYVPAKTLEQGANAIRKMVGTGEVDLVIVDSVARLITQSELDADTGTATVMDKAKMLYQFHRQIVDLLADNDCTLIWINHLLEKVDMTWAGRQKASKGIKEYTTPGGNAIPFFASLRLFFEQKGKIEAEIFDPVTNSLVNKPIGFKHEIYVKKNKVGKPHDTIEVVNILGEGFSQTRTAMEVFKAYGIVTNATSWYSLHEDRLTAIVGSKKAQGEEAMYRRLFVDNPEAKGVALTLARELLQNEYDSLESMPDTDPVEIPEELLQEGVLSGN